jgi:hypothetical protein
MGEIYVKGSDLENWRFSISTTAQRKLAQGNFFRPRLIVSCAALSNAH